MPASSAARRKAISNSLVALSGGALALNLLLIAGLILLIAVNGLGTFWQKRVVELSLDDGSRLLGEIHDREPIPDGEGTRIRLKVGNRELIGQDFLWLDERRVTAREEPREAVVLEMPIKYLCADSCAGICPGCGADLNEGACGCGDKPADPRWGPLKKLLKEENEK